jgi:hypothetical protein
MNKKLDQLLENNEKYFNILFSKMDSLTERLSAVETKIQQGVSFGNNTHNFQKIENKIDYLNTNVIVNSTCSIFDYLKSLDYVLDKSDIQNILRNSTTIYDTIVRILSELEVCYLYAFPFQKGIIYCWNQDKGTWEKTNQKTLKSIFETLQLKVVQQYNSLYTNGQIQCDNVEVAEYIFVDNFDKKYNDFRKTLFSKLIS